MKQRAKRTKNPLRGRGRDYISNDELLAEVIRSKRGFRKRHPAQSITPRLAAMFVMLAKNYGKLGNWRGYSYNEDMQAYAVLHLCSHWYKFDEKKYTNPFAYYTQFLYYCFLGFHAGEKRQHKVRDNLMEAAGHAPSSTRQVENEMRMAAESAAYEATLEAKPDEDEDDG